MVMMYFANVYYILYQGLTIATQKLKNVKTKKIDYIIL